MTLYEVTPLDVTEECKRLMERIEIAKKTLAADQAHLGLLRAACTHTWGEVLTSVQEIPGHTAMASLIHAEGGTIFHPTTYPPTKKTYYRRECSTCMLVQETSHTKDNVVKVPIFP